MSIQNAVQQTLKALMVISLALMCVLVFANVVMRYGFNSNILITEEVARYLFVWLTFLGSITAFAKNRHVRVVFVLNRLPDPWRAIVLILSRFAMLMCCAMVLIGCWQLAGLNLQNRLPISGLPVAVLYAAGIPFAICVGVMLVVRIWRAIRQLPRGETL
ncbi:UNVERIFIED_ORG: TRAP-type C4-dicarboxylate transport system permease small subunit [Martelella mediterranea]